MSESNSFQQIRSKLIRGSIPIGRNIPLDFTIRPIRKLDESFDFQLLYLDYTGDQRHMHTCIFSEDILKEEFLYMESNSKDLLRGLSLSNVPTTLAEQLMAERMRVSKEGVTFYDLDFDSDSLVFNYNGVMYHGYLKSNGEWITPESLDISNAMNVKRNPVNWRLCSYLNQNNVSIVDLCTKANVQLTFNDDNALGSGSTHFIIQEEFDRYEGMWWRPQEDNNGEYHLLIEEYDERAVALFSIPDYANGFETEKYRYPRPGNLNAESNLKMLKIGFDSISSTFTLLETLELPMSLMKLFPQYEYLTNCGWTPDGRFVWLQMMDRLQNVKSTYLLPLTSFLSSSSSLSPGNFPYAILYSREENAQFWVPVNQNTKFLKSFFGIKSLDNSNDLFACSAIMGTISSGFNHLYLINKYWSIPQLGSGSGFFVIEAETDSIVPLTAGPWQVDPENIWVDEKDNLVYFLANREDAIANYLYRVSYSNADPLTNTIQQLTAQDTNIYLEGGCDWAVVITSTLFQEHLVHFMNIKTCDVIKSVDKIRLSSGSPTNIRNIHETEYKLSLLSYDLIDELVVSNTLYGILFTPKSVQPRKWPTIHYVYGGPGVRIVRNNYNRNFLMLARMFNQFGFALLICDGRGSSGRGIVFEGHIKNKFGMVELQDQIFFLRKAAEETGLIDLDKVGIYGSSYGGYLTIMALLQNSDVYKCGFSCSPVVDFKFYDTAYTERYLGIPESNPEAYINASTLTYLSGLPTDCCRLTVAHGGQDENVHFLHTAHLLEEASSRGLDIKLLFYPTSRHRIKRREHLETNLISFMSTYLKN